MSKYKLKQKIISIFLVVLMIVGYAPVSAQTGSNESITETQNTEAEAVSITQDGQPVSAIDLPVDEKTVLKTDFMDAEAFQWQILLPDKNVWVNIVDKTADTCEVSYALVGALLDSESRVSLRCVVTADGQENCSDIVTVKITESTVLEPESGAGNRSSQKLGVSSYSMETVGNYMVSPLVEGNDLTTHTVTIKYLYFNEGPDTTGSVSNDYVATLATGTGYNAIVSSPVRTGYEPYKALRNKWDETENHWFTMDANGNINETGLESGTTFKIDITNIQENITYYVVYLPQNTTYNVSSYLQNIYDDFYTFGGIQAYAAKVGSSVLLTPVTDREGFTTLKYDDAKVAADGSTILDVYYDREYHLMNFHLDGGYGVEPVYARYQTGFKVSEPERAGYTFDGWEVTGVTYNGKDASTETIKATDKTYQEVAEEIATRLAAGETVEIPPFDINFKAKWNPNNAEYNVVYWKENANDDGYSYWGTVKSSATAGDTVTFESNADAFNIAKLSFSHKLVQEAVGANGNFSAIQACYEDEYFTYNADKSSPTASATVKGDGSTVLHVYYSRNKYNLKFYYARTNGVVSESTVTEYDRVTEIEDGQSYVVEMNRAVVNRASGSILSTKAQDGGLQLSGKMGDENITSLKFVVADANNNTYYIKSADEHYLTVTNYGASFTDAQTALKVYYENGYWGIGDASGSYWLNHFGGGTSTTAKGFTEDYRNSGTYLNLYKQDAASHEVTSIESTSNWEVATSTTNASIEGATWSDTGIKTMPVIKDNRYAIESERIGGYNYYYLELRGVKYNQQIANLWPCGVVPSIGGKTLINWGPVDGCAYRTKYGDNASIHIYPTVSAEIINDPKGPNSSKFVGWWSNGTANYQYFHIYYSPVLEGENKAKEYNGEDYAQQQDIQYIMMYNKWTRIDPVSLYGVTLVRSVITNPNPDSATEETMNSTFYYKRNSHELSFYNVGTPINNVPLFLFYGQPISSYNTYDKETMEEQYYPENYEPGAYSFKGWSLSPDTYIEVDWENYKMDDADLSVYAFWEKVTHTVTFYETYNALKNNQPIANGQEYGGISYNNPQTVSHGDPVNYASTISRDGYNFVGWFYIDEVTGEPVAFLPNNMPVNKDLKIYAEWQDAETMIKYTIHYMLIEATRDENGEYLFADGYKYNLDYSKQTQVADDTTGQIQDGRTKTFSAKALPELWTADNPNNTKHEDYCHNHYPMLSSHAIMFSPEQDQKDKAIKVIDKGTDENGKQIYEIDYTFYYVRLDEVKYTIKYINNDTKTNIFKDFSNTTASATITVDSVDKHTNEAVTTESMKMIQGYVPDAYQKRIVLTAFPKEGTDDNVITFNYTEDSNPMYFVEHLIENADGTWTQMAREFSTGTAGDNIVRTANNYPGHTFNANQGWVNTSGEYILPGEGENWIGEQSTTTVGETTKNIFIGGSKYTGNPASASGTLEAGKILVIRFYYTLNEYDYTIEHRILGNPNNNNWLFGTESESIETGSAKYGSIVTADASDNKKKQWKSLAYQDGYWVEGDQSDESRLKKTMQIKEDNNVITFWYVDAPVEIEYKVLVDGITDINVKGCYVTPSLDSTRSHGDVSDVHGSVPTAGPGYRFAGWYKDEGGTQSVENSWVGDDNKLKPQAETNDVIRSATYYAKFEPIKLTINITGNNVKEDDTFLFHIEGKENTPTAKVYITVSITGIGSTTVSYIPAGDYTITELNNWSWRYSPSSSTREYTVKADESNVVTFTNTPVTNKFWLGGESSIENKFSAIGS